MASRYPAPRTSAAALNEKTKNDSAHLRGGRHPSRAGRSLSGSVSIQLWLSAAQCVSGYSALPHCRARRSSRCLPELRTSGYLVQLVQEPALPQVPDPSSRALAGDPRARTVGHQLLPRRVHCAPRTQCAGPGKPASVLRSAIYGQRANLAGDRHRSQTLGSRDRSNQYPAHLGAESAPPSPHSLRHSRGRTLAGPPSLGPPTLSFLLTGEDPQPCLSWQVPRRPETSTQPQQAMLQRSRRRSGRPAAVCKTHAPPAPPRLGRLCQGRLRWSHAGVTVSRPLHPSCGDFQSSIVGLRPRARHLSLEGLRPRWQARQDDSCRHRVLTALLSARTSQRLRANPSLRVPHQSLSRFPPGTIPTTAVQQLLHACRSCILQSFGGGFFCLALPALRRDHDRGSEIYSCGIIHMHILRFVVALSSLPLSRCAPAHRCIRVPTPRQYATLPRSAHTSTGICDALNDHHATVTAHPCSPAARFGDQLPLKSHSAPPPPQTPAASS